MKTSITFKVRDWPAGTGQLHIDIDPPQELIAEIANNIRELLVAQGHDPVTISVGLSLSASSLVTTKPAAEPTK